MVKMILDLDDDNDEYVKQYMLDNKIKNKSDAINSIIEGLRK